MGHRFVIKADFVGGEPSRAIPGVGPAGMTRYAPTNKLRARLEAGLGEFQAEQLAVQRMFRETSETDDIPRQVITVEDVTRGLGLNVIDAQRVQKAVADTNVEFTPKTQTQRLTLARGRLVDLLRSMKEVDSGARLEIAKRAQAWWRKQHDTDLNRSRTVHFISYAQSRVQKSELRKTSQRVDRWITVNGARIPIVNGKMHGPVAEKILARKKKKGAGKTVSMTEAFKEGYHTGKHAGLGDVTALHETVKKQRERNERAREVVQRGWQGVRKSLVFTPPALRKIDLEWK